MLVGRTESVCPVCLRKLSAEKRTGADGYIYMDKQCPEHGKFSTLIWEDNLISYMRWNLGSSTVEPPVNGKDAKNGCPNDCGLCKEHLRKGCCMLLELTTRCNLRCPVCFASAGTEERELSMEEIERQYDYLMSHGGPFNIQLSGGEPSMRDDLPEIIALGRKKGFSFFQLNTNGIRLAADAEYARTLKAAGLNTVFLQFDGVDDAVYMALRGRALMTEKLAAIENCAAAGLGIVLVPVIAPGVNDAQVGDILRFALERMPAIRGVHFQPISYFGRCGLERPEKPITIPRMLRLIEEQMCGAMHAQDFAGGGAENPYCSFHASYLRRADGSLRLLPKKCESSALDDFLEQARRSTFAVSGMIFQDAYNLDLERLRRCYICEVDSEFGMVPFCAYNLTNTEGRALYRR